MHVSLSFDYQAVNLNDSGAVNCWISPDSGSTWHMLGTYNYNAGTGHAVYDISAYKSTDTRIKFETSSPIEMYLYIDNIRIDYERNPVYHPCDLNFDSTIDEKDLKIFIENFLK